MGDNHTPEETEDQSGGRGWPTRFLVPEKRVSSLSDGKGSRRRLDGRGPKKVLSKDSRPATKVVVI